MIGLHATPAAGDVVREQVRAVGHELRVPATSAAVLLALVTVALVAGMLRGGDAVDFRPERWLLPGLTGLLLPLAVWHGVARHGASLLWTLPVERSRHLIARVVAGWTWLMAAVALWMLWLFALALISGGDFLAGAGVRFLPMSAVPIVGGADPAAMRTVGWMPNPVFWLVPFTSATVMYVLTSALVLGPRRPGRWLVGTLFVLALVAGATSEIGLAMDSDRLVFATSRALHELLHSSWGLDMLLTGGNTRTRAVLSTGEAVTAWRGVPDAGRWLLTTVVWLAAGIVALAVAAYRHREHR